jgi:phage tail sheath protein FI
MGDFFHGAEAVDVASKLVAIAQENSSTIVLVGVAPGGPAGMTMVSSPVEAIQFGASAFDGRTIPHALDAIFAQNASRVVVINCFKDSHLEDVVDEAQAVGAGLVVSLNYIPVGGVNVTTNSSSALLSLGTDYSFNDGDQFLTILNRRLYPVGTSLKIDYSYFKKASVLPADIIGGITGNTRTGIQLMDLVYSRYGITPKILIAPVYVELETVCDALVAKAETLRARVIVDAPVTETIAGVIASRSTAGDYVNFATGNKRVVGVFPYIIKPDPSDPTSDGQPYPYSAYYAGHWSASIEANGIKQSPSNLPLYGFSKLVADISCGIGDKTSDASLLSAAGICTIYSNYGSGNKSWGNHNLSFPESGTMDSFLSVQLTQDIIDESVLAASLAFQDKPLDLALIDSIVSAVNNFLNTLILSRDIIDGSASYDPAKNTAAQLSTGKLVIDMSFLPPGPAEHIVFQSFIDVSLYSNLS